MKFVYEKIIFTKLLFPVRMTEPRLAASALHSDWLFRIVSHRRCHDRQEEISPNIIPLPMQENYNLRLQTPIKFECVFKLC